MQHAAIQQWLRKKAAAAPGRARARDHFFLHLCRGLVRFQRGRVWLLRIVFRQAAPSDARRHRGGESLVRRAALLGKPADQPGVSRHAPAPELPRSRSRLDRITRRLDLAARLSWSFDADDRRPVIDRPALGRDRVEQYDEVHSAVPARRCRLFPCSGRPAAEGWTGFVRRIDDDRGIIQSISGLSPIAQPRRRRVPEGGTRRTQLNQ